MNGAKPGASERFWVKGGAGVLVGPINQSISRWAIEGGRRKVERGCSRYCFFSFGLKQEINVLAAVFSKRRAVTSQGGGG